MLGSEASKARGYGRDLVVPRFGTAAAALSLRRAAAPADRRRRVGDPGLGRPVRAGPRPRGAPQAGGDSKRAAGGAGEPAGHAVWAVAERGLADLAVPVRRRLLRRVGPRPPVRR